VHRGGTVERNEVVSVGVEHEVDGVVGMLTAFLHIVCVIGMTKPRNGERNAAAAQSID
jgi:Na+(H+)/acetate symporter ActP